VHLALYGPRGSVIFDLPADYALVKFEGRSGKLPFGGSLCIAALVTPRRGPGPRQSRGPAVPEFPRRADRDRGVAGKDGRRIDSMCQLAACDCSSGRQGRSSRLAPGPDPGRRSPGCISGAPRRRRAGALPGRLPGRGCERLGCARGLAPLDDRHQGGELVTGRGWIQEDDRFFSPNAPGRQEDGLSAQPGLQLTPAARWRHGSGMTASPAATASCGSRRRPIWRCGPGGVTAWHAASGAVVDGCGC
jgi:hypothetical protein